MICPECGSSNVAEASFMWSWYKYHCLSCGHDWSRFDPVKFLSWIGATVFGVAGAIYYTRKKEGEE